MAKVSKRTGGPKTKSGKEISSKNARTHGLTAKKWLDDEEQALYDDLLKELSADLKPQGFAQELMIARLADCTVRMNRTQRIEDALYSLAKSEATNPEKVINSLTNNEALRKDAINQYSALTHKPSQLNEDRLYLLFELDAILPSDISGFTYVVENLPYTYSYLCDQSQKEHLSIHDFIDRETYSGGVRIVVVHASDIDKPKLKLTNEELLRDAEKISSTNLRTYLKKLVEVISRELRVKSVMVNFNKRKHALKAAATPDAQKMSLLHRYRTADERLFSKILGEFYEMQKIKGQR